MTNSEEELERLAWAATPGKRTYDPEGQIVWGQNGEHIADMRGVGAGLPVDDNGKFTAALDQQTVLALIERVRALEARKELQNAEYTAIITNLAKALFPDSPESSAQAEFFIDAMGACQVIDRLRTENEQFKSESKGTARLTLEELRDIKGVMDGVYDPGYLTPAKMNYAKLRDKVYIMIEAKIKEVQGE